MIRTVVRGQCLKLAFQRVDTGIYRFTHAQFQPCRSSVAFIAPWPQFPGKVTEPLLLFVENETGKVGAAWL